MNLTSCNLVLVARRGQAQQVKAGPAEPSYVRFLSQGKDRLQKFAAEYGRGLQAVEVVSMDLAQEGAFEMHLRMLVTRSRHCVAEQRLI